MLILLLWCLQLCLDGQSLPYVIDLEQIDNKSGLLGHRVQYTFEDKRGLIWATTAEGLNRYDGRNIKCYKEFASSDYFNSNQIIYESADHLLWIIDLKGYQVSPSPFIMDSYTGEVFKFESKIDVPFDWEDIVNSYQGADGRLYFTSKLNEIHVYHSNNKFTKIEVNDIEEYFRILYVSLDGEIWVQQSGHSRNNFKLIRYKGNNSLVFDFTRQNKKLYKDISFVKETDDATLFFQFDDHYFYFISVSRAGNLSVEKYKDIKEVPFSLLKQYALPIQSEEHDVSDYLFSLYGLKIFSHSGEVLYDIMEQHPDIKIPLNERRSYLLIQSSNLLFINNNQGVLKVHFKKNRFQQFLKTTGKSANCRRILKSSNGDLIFNGNNQLWKNNSPFRFSKNPKYQYLLDFIEDRHNNLWAWNGHDLNYISPEAKIIKTISLSPRLIPFHHFSFSIYEITEDQLFIGGTEKSFIYDIESDHVSDLKTDISYLGAGEHWYAYSIQKDKYGNHWTASNKGLLLTDFDKKEVSSNWERDGNNIVLPRSMVHHFYQDSSAVFWLVGQNLRRWDSKTNDIITYKIEDGLPSSIIHAIYPDAFGNLWMSTEYGISCFNKKTKRFKNYFTSDGITNNEFNRMSHFQDEDGTIYFGGINGITIFHPRDFQGEDFRIKAQQILITGYEQYMGEAEEIVDKLPDLMVQKKIVLNPNDRFFKIHFTFPDYAQNELIDYEYKISGHQDNWRSTNENYLQISGLPYGNYDLQLRAKLPFGTYAQNQLTIPIEILRPFYLQLWFILLSILLMAGAIFTFYKVRVRRLKQQKLNLEQLVDQKTRVIQSQKVALENSNAFKDRLFAIIAHDMRSAVASFTGLTDTIKTFIKFNQPEKILKMQDAIDRSSDKLGHLLENLLEWALSQRGDIKHQSEFILLHELLTENILPFQSIANKKSVQIEVDAKHDLQIHADRDALNTILRNLINNAIKFTPPEGKIVLSVISSSDEHTIRVKDTGVGMTEEILNALFLPLPNKSQKDLNGQQGSGIGLILVKELVELNGGTIKVASKAQEGSSFYLSFPRGN